MCDYPNKMIDFDNQKLCFDLFHLKNQIPDIKKIPYSEIETKINIVGHSRAQPRNWLVIYKCSSLQIQSIIF